MLHLYQVQSEAEIRAKYNKPLEKMMNKKSSERLRAVVYTQIAVGKWEEYIVSLIPVGLVR